MLRKITDHKVLQPYQVWLRYDDDVEGTVDLSDFARLPVFSSWQDEELFKSLKVEGGRHFYWSEDLDLCPDALYIQLTGVNPYA